jgi:hypothetical protein
MSVLLRSLSVLGFACLLMVGCGEKEAAAPAEVAPVAAPMEAAPVEAAPVAGGYEQPLKSAFLALLLTRKL